MAAKPSSTKTAKAKSKKPAPKTVQKSKGPVKNSNKFTLKFPSYKTYKDQKSSLPGAFRLFGRAVKILWQNYRVFAWLLVIYALVEIVAIHPSLTATSGLKHLKSTSGTNSLLGGIGEGFVLFIYLLGNGNDTGTGVSTSTSSTTNSPPYSAFLAIAMSLVVIWALRQVYAGAKIRARDAFYRGLTPLVSFFLVLVVIGLEMLPGIFGGFLYATVMNNGIAASLPERILWLVLLILLVVLTFYMIASSLFALYVVTLDDMTPMKALRSAREIVRSRRLAVLVKVIFLPLALIVVAGVVMIPVLLFATAAAPAILLLLLLVGLFVLHSYMYALYRELLP